MASLSSLGPRLQAIYDVVALAQKQQRYDRIWDCCCDHGYLGIKMLGDGLCEKLYFVDQVPHIIQQLETRLVAFPKDAYGVIVGDAAALHFSAEQRHLVILAGVGGEHIIDIIHGIGESHPSGQIDFLFCPTTTQYNLREYLSAEGFVLVSESIASEKGRDYEVVHVRGKAVDSHQPRVSLTGAMWDGQKPEHRRYLNKLMTHYQNRMRGEEAERSKAILQVYQDCLEKITAA